MFSRYAALCVRSVVLSALVALTCGCQRPSDNIADRTDADLSALLKAFGCARDGTAVQACRILAEFASAHAFKEWPASAESWWGRKYCSDAPNDGTIFAALHLLPGRGKALSTSVKPVEADVLPNGAEYPLMTVAAATLAEWTPLLNAVQAGRVPGFKSELDREHYESLRRPAVADSAYLLTRTDGASFRGGAGLGRYYGRDGGTKLLIVEPRTGESACVAELWKVP